MATDGDGGGTSGRNVDRRRFLSAGATALLGLAVGGSRAGAETMTGDASLFGPGGAEAMWGGFGGAGAGEEADAVLIADPLRFPNRTPDEMQYELFKRGMELQDDANFEAAEAQWTEIIESFETPAFREAGEKNKFLLARAYANRGGARLNLMRTREAILDFSSSISLAPDRGEFWMSRGTAYEDMADRNVLLVDDRQQLTAAAARRDARVFYESALSDYDHAAVLDPADPRVHMSRGDALSLLGNHQDALLNYRKAAMLNPTVPEFRSRVALEEIQCGNLDRGAAMIKTILRRFPGHPEMLLAASAVAWEYGELSEAKDMYNEAISLEPRLLDDDFLFFVLRWPAVPLSMLKTVRRAGTENSLAAVRTLIGESV
ncbi:unnamed protein product [Phaeothamnion confervicola]